MREHRRLAIVCAVALIMTLVPGKQVFASAAGANPGGLTEELNKYAGFIGRRLDRQEVSFLESALSSPRPEVRALGAALLFRTDPQKYRAELTSHFAVNDYAARAKGQIQMISQDDLVAKVKHLEREVPGVEPSLMLVVGFVAFRDSNLWFRQGDQNLSVARFFRSAFLAQALKGTMPDAVTVANELDQEARSEYERGARSSR